MKQIHLILILLVALSTASCNGQSKDDALNGLYMNKFGQLIYFDNGNMYFYKSTFRHVFQKMEKETYKYENKKVVYKYDDIELTHENGKVTSLNHRSRNYKRMVTIGDIIEFKNLDTAKILKRINENESLTAQDIDKAMKRTDYLEYVDMFAKKIAVDDMLVQTFKAQ